MLTLKFIEENTDFVIERLKVKNFTDGDLIHQIVADYQSLRKIKSSMDEGLRQMNVLSKEIGQLFKEGKVEEANRAKAKTGELKESNRALEKQYADTENKIYDALLQVPNLPHELVKPGNSEEDNEIIKIVNEAPELSVNAVPHWDLIKKHNLIDFELGNKITGAGFPVYKGKGARLQRALISFFLDSATENGYEEVLPPLVINEASGYGTGQLPDKEGQMYHITEDDLYLIPTAEVPVTNLYRGEIVNEEDLPIKNCAYSACFRREAGAWGANVRGLNRLHQFDKVEIVHIEHPGRSYDTLDEMVVYVSSLLEKLELPFRILRLCGGDTSFTAAMTYDFEVFSAAQKRWLEVSSVSNFESFQANRMKLRYKGKDQKKPVLAHTLNGSALALPRIMAALLENNQMDDGIRIPVALQKYTGFDAI